MPNFIEAKQGKTKKQFCIDFTSTHIYLGISWYKVRIAQVVNQMKYDFYTHFLSMTFVYFVFH